MAEQHSESFVLREMLAGKWVSQAIGTAAELGIADLLKDGPRSSAEISAKTGASEDGVYRLLRALAGVGLFSESEGRCFALTALGAYLRSDVPGSMRGYARFFGHDLTWRPWGQLVHSVKTGKPAVDLVFGMPVFDYVATRPEAAAVVSDGMTSLSRMEAPAVTSAYDFQGIGTLVDVGGGQGLLLATILKANPGMRGILFDMPHVIESARTLLENEGIINRCETVGGDFFAAVPEGGDACIMKHILHNWDDERSIQILRNCHRAMRQGGRVLVVEVVIGPANESNYVMCYDLQMLVMTPGGRERTEDEYRKFYEAAGFRLTRVVATEAAPSIVEGIAI